MQLKYIRHWILFSTFSFLYGFGTWLVELLEGSKISSTEHIDFGVALIFYGFIVGSFVFGVIMFPLTLIIEKFFNKLLIKMIIFLAVGYSFGKLLFGIIFYSEHVQDYNLYELTSVFVFIGISFIYTFIDSYTYRKLI
ncbi:hypothetical protein [Salirhabdus sp. Marseille-P4669]|uniref:hypothetical protein n=1 Tax=Salirhabdus sp. Marseille-P4669 TaxID=2042310 RepID=UPI000C7C7180|nr:hypothetical protein [Salirhabdus sp. Marseille-P4669]